MKATGIVRKIDSLGRIVLPKETRDILNMNVGDPLEIYTDENSIMLKKYKAGCIFCNECSNLVTFKGQKICEKCLTDIEAVNMFEGKKQKNLY